MPSCTSAARLLATFAALNLGAAQNAHADEPKPKVAAFGLKAVGDVTPDQIGVFVDLLLVRIERTGRYETTSQADIVALVSQEKLKEELCAADSISCYAEIGGAAGSDYLLSGTVSAGDGRYLIILTLIDVGQVRSVKRESFEAFGGPGALYAKVDEVVSRLFGGAGKGAGGAAGIVLQGVA